MNDTIGFERHDHGACIETAMSAAEAICAENKLQFTSVRRRVLEILLIEHKAMGAYDVLEKLSAEDRGSQPPVAYRALDFLVRNGFAHKVEKLNAYIACAHPGAAHAPAFMICRECGAVAEAPARRGTGALGTAARASGFRIESTVMEAEGICPECAENAK